MRIDPKMVAAFEPDAAPARERIDPSMVAGFTPDAGAVDETGLPVDYGRESPVDPNAPGYVESLARGGLQGASFGLSDEAIGFLESLWSDKTYEQARDESRAANEAARTANPKTYLAGEIGGGVASTFVPGVGAAHGASTAAKLGRAAIEGGIAGGGYSEAKDAGGVAKDVVLGAGLGGAIGAAGMAASAGLRAAALKIARGAPDRATKRIVQEIVSATNPKQRNALLGESGIKAERVGKLVLEDDELFAAHRNPVQFVDTIDTKLTDAAKPLDQLFEQVDKLDPGMDPRPAIKTIQRYADNARKAFKPNVAAAFDQAAESRLALLEGQLVDETGKHFPVLEKGIKRDWSEKQKYFLPASQMRQLVGGLQGDAWMGSAFEPPPIKAAMRKMTGELRDMLNEHVEAVAKRAGLEVRLDGKPVALKEINQRISDLINLRDVAERSATRARGATEVSPFSMKNVKMLAGNPLVAIPTFAANPTLGGALAAAQIGVKGARALDDRLARSAIKRGAADVVPGTEGFHLTNAAEAVAPGRFTRTASRAAEAGQEAGKLEGWEQAHHEEKVPGGARRAAVTAITDDSESRRRRNQAELAGMARQGQSVDRILARARDLGIDAVRAQRIAKLFGPS